MPTSTLLGYGRLDTNEQVQATQAQVFMLGAATGSTIQKAKVEVRAVLRL